MSHWKKLLVVVPNRKIDTRRQRKNDFHTDYVPKPATDPNYRSRKSKNYLTIVCLVNSKEAGIEKLNVSAYNKISLRFCKRHQQKLPSFRDFQVFIKHKNIKEVIDFTLYRKIINPD